MNKRFRRLVTGIVALLMCLLMVQPLFAADPELLPADADAAQDVVTEEPASQNPADDPATVSEALLPMDSFMELTFEDGLMPEAPTQALAEEPAAVFSADAAKEPADTQVAAEEPASDKPYTFTVSVKPADTAAESGEQREETTPATESGEQPEGTTPASETDSSEDATDPATESDEQQETTTPVSEAAAPENSTDPNAESGELQEETTPATEPGEQQEETTPAAESDEQQEETTPATESDEQQEETTPATESEEQQKGEDPDAELELADIPEITGTGFFFVGDLWCWYQDGVFRQDWSGIVKGKIGNTTAWYYVKNGVYDPTAKGLTKRADGTGRWYYVENGTFKSATGIAKRTDGSSVKWFYVKDGVFLNTSGLVKKADNSTDRLYFIQNGVWKRNSGIAKLANDSKSKWLYVANGVHTNASGLTKRADGSSPKWFYVENGVFKTATGISKRADGSSPRWYYVEKGVFKNATGITQRTDNSSDQWYYVQNGAFTTAKGAAPKADNSSTDLYYVEDGIYTNKTCLAEKADKSSYDAYYMNNGIFDPTFNGVYELCTVVNGISHRYPGLDISYWNGTLDFEKIKAAGYEFIIPRIGWGIDEMDPTIPTYVPQALAAGIQVPGVYHFIYAISPTEAIKNAKSAIKFVEQAGLPKTTVIWCDLEYDTVTQAAARGVTLKASHQKKYVEAFCDYILSKGYPTGVYVNQDYMYRVFGTDFGSKYDLWLADYEDDAAYPCVYRQVGGTEIPDHPWLFDLNVYYGQYTAGTSLPR